MSIKLDWIENLPSPNPIVAAVGVNIENVVHSAIFKELAEAKIKLAIINCIDKAVKLLPKNIGDDSRYFLFEWNVVNSTLTIVVTDDSKENDSRHVVKCTMLTLNEKMNVLASSSEAMWQTKTEEFSESVKNLHLS